MVPSPLFNCAKYTIIILCGLMTGFCIYLVVKSMSIAGVFMEKWYMVEQNANVNIIQAKGMTSKLYLKTRQ